VSAREAVSISSRVQAVLGADAAPLAPSLPPRSPPALRLVPGERLHYPAFDWLRAALALTVALVHDSVIGWPSAGRLAVQVFFALSGWLIGGILLETKSSDLPRFYFQRATRIWIPYAAALALILGLGVVRDPITAIWVELVFYKLTFVYNLFVPSRLVELGPEMPLDGTAHHFWSICAEEQFYLFAPLVLLFVPRGAGRSLLVWAAICLVAFGLDVYGGIAIGVLAALARRRFGDWHRAVLARAALGAVALLTGGLLALEIGPFAWISPLFAIAVVLGLAQPGARSPIGAFAGGVSYPFYLNHWIGPFAAHFVLRPFGLRDSALAHVLALATNVAACSLLYVAIDRQVLRRRDAFYSRRLGTALAATGFALVALGLATAAVLHLAR
jgi:peptidoglycan/LPS O-acetylase OafA/YrhL